LGEAPTPTVGTLIMIGIDDDKSVAGSNARAGEPSDRDTTQDARKRGGSVVGTKRTKPDAAQIEEVWRRFKATGDQRLRNILIERYLPLVRYIAERLLAKLPQNSELDDLQSAGIFGLMDAVDGFDLDRGVKFETYCTTRIRGAILDELRSLDWVPRIVRNKANRIDQVWKTLE